MFGFFPVFLKGKEAPKIKNFWGQVSLGGGRARRGVSGEILYVYAFFSGSDQGSGALRNVK